MTDRDLVEIRDKKRLRLSGRREVDFVDIEIALANRDESEPASAWQPERSPAGAGKIQHVVRRAIERENSKHVAPGLQRPGGDTRAVR